MQLITNYLDNIKDHLPEELQQEVCDELEASIYGQVEDKQQELNRDLNEKEVEEILLQIGHPMRVASAYLPGQEVVGKELFPAYKKALEITLTVAFVIIILTMVPAMFETRSIIGGAISIFAEIIDTSLYVFAVVTLVFYLMGYYGVDLNEIYAWSPKDLKGKAPKLKISRVETGFELVIYIAFLAWWNNLFTWPADIFHEGQSATVSLSGEWIKVALSINIVMVLSVLVGIHKFIIASWTKFSLATDIALSLAAIAICFQISQFYEFVVYSEEFAQNENWETVRTIMNNIVYSFLIVISVISAWEIFSNFKKIINK